MIDFRTIHFGFKSAEAERRHDPQLLTDGFFHKDNAVEDLVSGRQFLVLGYKGSGKSAIAEHIDLRADSDPERFAQIVLLRDFPFEEIPKLVPGDADESVRTNLAWSLLLAIKLFESLLQDNAATEGSSEIQRIAKEFESLGLLPRKKLSDLVLASREVNLSATLPKVFSSGTKRTFKQPVMVLSQVRERLKDVIRQAHTRNAHLLFVDGLDDVFTRFDSNYATLASLIHEADALNAELSNGRPRAKVIVLCRTDLFERLPSPNINKLRDFAVGLDWYQDPRRPKQSKLMALATHRARLRGYVGQDVVGDYFPESLRDLWKTPTMRFLLDHTRHTPRDFLQVLTHVQAEAKGADGPSQRAVLSGLRTYSINYFLPELKDELSGYFSPDEVEECFRIIGGVRRREFSFSDLETYKSEIHLGGTLDLREALRVLFDCSAVGNIVERPRSSGRAGHYFTFRYRNRNAAVNLTERFIIHRGAWKALNIT